MVRALQYQNLMIDTNKSDTNKIIDLTEFSDHEDDSDEDENENIDYIIENLNIF